MKIIYFASNSPLSLKPLKALLRRMQNVNTPLKLEICAIVSEHFNPDSSLGNNISIIDTRSDTPQSLAHTHSIPFIKVQNRLEDTVSLLQAAQPDIILVSCFSRKIPDLIYSIPTLGSFNLHPSLLPEYQGPDPLFWQFRAEKCVFGVSLHRITAGLDRGNIVLQKTLVMPEGISKQDATHLLAHTAGELALRLVETIHQKPLAEIPQNPALMSYQGLAHANDYIVSHTWTARRLYNFICAYQQAGRYFQCRINEQTLYLSRALSYQVQTDADSQHLSFADQPYVIHSALYRSEKTRHKPGELTLVCAEGFIQCKFQDSPENMPES